MDMAASSSSSPMDEPPQHHDLQQQQHPPPPLKEFLHKTKLIQFLGRTTPIILQNNNGPCPLLAICNVLLQRNQLSLGSDIAEVSQEKLLSLVAERLIDSNSNVNNKDAGYLENQLQNIADAIDLLPRLATGIDVNLKFTRIDDFEFTPECAIFDLLDIPLRHGWLVDPQDHDTATAIGSKSYNALMEKLVYLETRNIEIPPKNNPEEEDCVDFVAATTAALGVPSPSLSKARSFDDSPHSVSDQAPRKGDLEEEEELLRALKLSDIDSKASISSDPFVGHANDNGGEVSFGMDENTCNKQAVTVDSGVDLGKSTGKETNDFHESETAIPDDCTVSSKHYNEHISSTSTVGEAANSSLKNDAVSDFHQSPSMEPKESIERNDVVEKQNLDASVQNESAVTLSPEKYSVSISESCADGTRGDEKVHNQSSLTTIAHEVSDESQGPDATGVSCLSASHTNSDSSSIRFHQTDASRAFSSTVDGSEPRYEGEECVLDTRTGNFGDRGPVYKGEVVLQEQADKSTLAAADLRAKEEITPEQGELVKRFLSNNASQLTLCGLLSLQSGLKEQELCVFFRNNHFSTMFKFEGELYLLVTDEGYIKLPDLVWEKLKEVNGDTLFMTGNFKEFKVESQENNTWDENNVTTSTADYLAGIDSESQAGLIDPAIYDEEMSIFLFPSSAALGTPAMEYLEGMSSSCEDELLDSPDNSSKVTTSICHDKIPAAGDNKEVNDVTIDAPSAYFAEIYSFYKKVENEGRPSDYMDSKSEINKSKRTELFGWLIGVHTEYKLSQQGLYLTTNVVDRFLAINAVKDEDLLLVGIGAMLIASKYEGNNLKVNTIARLLPVHRYTGSQILSMEREILAALEWNLTFPTQFHFLVLFLEKAMVGQVHSYFADLVHYLSELWMIHCDTIMYRPSLISAAAVYAARCTLLMFPLWNQTLQEQTGYSEGQLMDCAMMLVSLHREVGENLPALVKKYSQVADFKLASFNNWFG